MDRSKWEYKKLGEVASFERGLTYSKIDESDSSTKGVLRSNNIDLDSHQLVFDEIKWLNESFEIPQSKKLAKDSIFICMSNGSKAHLGKVAFIDKDYDYAFGGFMGMIKPLNIYPKYLFYYFLSKEYRDGLEQIGKGANINNLRFAQLANFMIPNPVTDDQQRIVAELDCLNEMIALKQEQLKEFDKLAQSIFYDMFGDPVTNEKGWKLSKLGEIGELGRGVSKHRPRNAPELLGGNMPLIQTGDVANAEMYITEYNATYSELGVKQSKIWKAGTLCITIAATIGKCAILSFDACFPDSVVGFSTNEELTNNEYIFYIFMSLQKMLEQNAPAVAQKNINLAVLNALDIPLPPLAMQQQFAEKIQAIEAQKELVKQSIAETQQLFDSRMDYYFN